MPVHNVWRRLRSYPTWVKLTLTVYSIGFLIGTTTHLIAFLNGWWLPHHPLINTYWGSLTFLDPLVVFLLLRFPRTGLLLSLVIIASDVGVNSLATYLYFDSDGRYAVDYFIQLQTAFLGFVLGSAPFLWAQFNVKSAA
jgi:membrane protein HdeD